MIILINEIYPKLKKYLQDNSKYSPLVTKKTLKQSKKFPMVVITEEDNSFHFGTTKTKKREIVSSLAYKVEIYAVDKQIGNKIVSNVEIVEELEKLVDDVLGNSYGFDRLSCRPTPNLDETIYGVTMR